MCAVTKPHSQPEVLLVCCLHTVHNFLQSTVKVWPHARLASCHAKHWQMSDKLEETPRQRTTANCSSILPTVFNACFSSEANIWINDSICKGTSWTNNWLQFNLSPKSSNYKTKHFKQKQKLTNSCFSPWFAGRSSKSSVYLWQIVSDVVDEWCSAGLLP